MTLTVFTFTALGTLSLLHGVYDLRCRVDYYQTPEAEVELSKDGGASLALIFWYYAPAALSVLTGACLLGVGLNGLLTGGS